MELGIPLAIDDVYDMPVEAPYGFNRSFDERTGYHTKSMLVVPMVNAFNYVIGVLQLINHKIDPAVKIRVSEYFARNAKKTDRRSDIYVKSAHKSSFWSRSRNRCESR